MKHLSTSSDWWASTLSPPQMFRLGYRSAEAEAFLRTHVGVDPAILAAELGMGVDQVMAYQRRLGLRKCAAPGGRRA